jgi:hypothetical protein
VSGTEAPTARPMTPAELAGEQADAIRDVAVGVRAILANDGDGVAAVLNHSAYPRIALGITLVAMVDLLHSAQPPLTPEDIDRILATLTANLTNIALDGALAASGVTRG